MDPGDQFPDERRRGRLIGRTKGGMNTKLHAICDSLDARSTVCDRWPGPVAGLCRSFDHVSCRKGEHRWDHDRLRNSC
jgi:hypothetical protein